MAAATPAMSNAAAQPGARCDDQPVLMVVDGKTIDRERMRTYTKKLIESGLYARLGGYYINSPRPIATFEGVTPADHVTLVVRFPCLANARSFWYSKVYQDTIRPLRIDPLAGDFTVRIYLEVPPPGYMAGKIDRNAYLSPFPPDGIEPVTDAAGPPTTTPAPRVRRTTLVVANLERSLAFYRDVLGFRVGNVHAMPASSSGFAIFNVPTVDGARFAVLDAGEQHDILGLIESPSYRGEHDATRGAALVVKVPFALAEARRRLAASPAHLLAPSRSGSNDEQAVVDPDGHLVVLYELAM